MDRPQIIFTAEKVKSLRRAYEKAKAAKQDQFVWEGHELVTDYAKYLLEFLSTKFRV